MSRFGDDRVAPIRRIPAGVVMADDQRRSANAMGECSLPAPVLPCILSGMRLAVMPEGDQLPRGALLLGDAARRLSHRSDLDAGGLGAVRRVCGFAR